MNQLLFICIGIIIVLFITGNFYRILIPSAKLATLLVFTLLLADILMLNFTGKGIQAFRETPNRLSNGDNNRINIYIENLYRFRTSVKVIDEIPFQFQIRDFALNVKLPPGEGELLTYTVRPVKRGEYDFGDLNAFVTGPVGFASRRFRFQQSSSVPVYPSFIQMHRYELLAISDNITESGIKRIRRIGHTMEFDHIRSYVKGDDYRTINWKATARKGKVMVNQYQDERSQPVYSIIDMGRVMEMPFEEMSLLDYAINTSLAISNIAIKKQDKVGIVTFSNTINALLPADRRHSQIFKILEILYNQKTDFLESDYEKLYAAIVKKIHQRSLLLLYTNFETLSSLKRNLNNLRKIAGKHLLVIIFFENTELKHFIGRRASSVEEIYNKTIAEKFIFEKKQIVKELGLYGIHSILTTPSELTVNTINKYLELKARGLI